MYTTHGENVFLTNVFIEDGVKRKLFSLVAGHLEDEVCTVNALDYVFVTSKQLMRLHWSAPNCDLYSFTSFVAAFDTDSTEAIIECVKGIFYIESFGVGSIFRENALRRFDGF